MDAVTAVISAEPHSHDILRFVAAHTLLLFPPKSVRSENLLMVFNSRVFLFVFLPVAYFVFWKLSSKQQRYIWLTVAGYVFYSFWNYKFCAIMAFSTLVSYLAGIGLLRFQDSQRRKFCLIFPIAVDLSLLSFFKYQGIWKFALSSGEWLASLWGMNTASSLLWKFHLHSLLWGRDFLSGALLPVGISFYTFHTIS